MSCIGSLRGQGESAGRNSRHLYRQGMTLFFFRHVV